MATPKLISPISKQGIKKLRVAAYCRVSSSSADQLNSYARQIETYTRIINANNEWVLVDIFADEGISGTKADNRTEFQKLIRLCELRQVDLILTKSISRFARNTKEALYMYKKWLGYKKGEDGIPEIIPYEAKVVERIFEMYLAGSPVDVIAKTLQKENLQFKEKKFTFSKQMIMSILRNEKYCGDCILQKTVTLDPIDKTRKANEGEAPMWLVENCHPAIITREMFNKVQEEISRRNAYTPQSNKTALTATGKYSKYALTDVLQCGECGTRFRRVTWSKRGKKKIVWRCVSRLDYGTKYCKDSLTVEETELQDAIVRALNKFNEEDSATYLMLMRSTIGEAIGLNGGSDEIDLLQRRIDALNKRMLTLVNESVQEGADIESHEDDFKEISEQIDQLNGRIKAIRESEHQDGELQTRLAEIQTTIDKRENNKNAYDDSIVRQMVECIKVFKDGKIIVTFGGGYEIEEQIKK